MAASGFLIASFYEEKHDGQRLLENILGYNWKF
jgi:hypothetical protein